MYPLVHIYHHSQKQRSSVFFLIFVHHLISIRMHVVIVPKNTDIIHVCDTPQTFTN